MINLFSPGTLTPSALNVEQSKRFTKLSNHEGIDTIFLLGMSDIPAIQENGRVKVTIPGSGCGQVFYRATNVKYKSLNEWVWNGEVDSEDTCTCDIGHLMAMYKDGELFGTISLDTSSYFFENLSDGVQAMARMDNAYEAMECEMPDGGEEMQQSPAVEDRSNGDCIVRVFAFFTQAADNAVSNIQNRIESSIEQMNQALSNSDVPEYRLRLELTGTEELSSFSENALDIRGDVGAFSMNSIVNARREQADVRADLMILFTEGNYHRIAVDTTGGANDTITINIYGTALSLSLSPDSAFAIIEAQQATSKKTFAHEVGHLFGAKHQQCTHYQNPGCTASPVAEEHGYSFKTGCWPFKEERTTIMHQQRQYYNRELYYSNPDVKVKGKPTGVAGTNDVAKWLRDNSCTVAYFIDPPPASADFVAFISGEEFAGLGEMVPLEAVHQGGTAPYSYQWRRSYDGFNYETNPFSTAQSVTVQSSSQNLGRIWVRLDVTSNDGQTAVDFHSIKSYEDDPFGGGNPNDILFSKPEQSAFLFEAFPNPSSGSVTVRFSLEKSEPAKLTVFNTTGELLQEIAFDAGEKGSQTYSWNGNNVPTGLYLFKLDIGGKSESKLISLLR